MTIEEFIAARIAEDEALARAATGEEWSWEGDYPYGHCPHRTQWCDHGPDLVSDSGPVAVANGYDASGLEIVDADADHIVRHDPARVLRQCAAFQIVLEFWQGLTRLRTIAAIWSDHPDYCEEWAA